MRKGPPQALRRVCADTESSMIACKFEQLLQEIIKIRMIVSDRAKYSPESRVNVSGLLLFARLGMKRNIIADECVECLFGAAEQALDFTPVIFIKEGLLLLRKPH